MNKTFESLKNYIIEADTSISDLLDLYNKKSAELDKVSQLTEDLSKKLLESENINREARKEIESLINYVKNN
ncbi:MAG: hypothetical protein VX753_00345 [Pseudomonadota bacterium]|nr:hypothetical protein [Pseudomonadota bacterium]MEC7961259.1 hypothetical protein [Pseudomonadota bacterium]MEC8019993.1 hypothetical protein [Pseudomonadota bacterium]|tara:strand:- start:724 stop:939 length:216 start_codon:yes stop_codon:yes gene_type:complete